MGIRRQVTATAHAARPPTGVLCPTPLVREATPADVVALLPLWLGMMRQHLRYSAAFALACDAPHAWRQSLIDLMQRPDGFVFLAHSAGGPVGYCSGFVAQNPAIYETRAVGLINEMVVARAARRRGLGTALLQAAVAFFSRRELSEFQLSSAAHNTMGRRFWRRHGGQALLVRYRFELPAPALF